MMTDTQILEVVAAHKEGKKIEYSWGTFVNWYEFFPQDKWNFERYLYRVVPVPHKPREWRLPASLLDSTDIIKQIVNNGEPEIIVREVLE